MIHVLHVYRIPTTNSLSFVSALRHGGCWHEFARNLRGYVGTDVIQSHDNPSLYLATEFWISEDLRDQSLYFPGIAAHRQQIDNLAVAHWNLGSFSFPPYADGSMDLSSRQPRIHRIS